MDDDRRVSRCFVWTTASLLTKMNPQYFADSMLQHALEESKIIEDQREEILRAFVSKYGFQPDNIQQVECRENGSRSWTTIYISDEDVQKIRRGLLISRVSKESLSLWQKFCVWLASGKWPK